MSIRFQADADLNQIIVTALVRRVPQIDFRRATAASLAGLKDADVLALAARDGRILVTHDQSTMPRHFGEFVRSAQSPGLIIVPQTLAVPEAVDSLILVWGATQPEEWINRIIYLPI
jgi:predicted nuclease of predicted toxin-antitoxin system